MEIAKNTEITLPNWQNINESFKITPFQESKEGKTLLKQWDGNVKVASIIKKAGMVAAVLIFIIGIIENGTHKWFSVLILSGITFTLFYVVYKIYQKTVVKITETRYFKKRNKFTQKLADTMVDYFGGYGYYFNNAHCFVYNHDMCIYINANEGSWIGFHKGNIKDVELEHVHLGSTTISTTQTSGSAYAWTNNYATYGGSSTTVSNTTTHYEWRLDIYTDYIDYPHLTVVFPEYNEGEKYAKRARALLKP